MAIEHKGMAEEFKENSKNWREIRAAAMAGELYEKGILASPSQRTISGEALKDAFTWYGLKKAESSTPKEGKAKGNTGWIGQMLDSGNRMHMQYARKLPMDIADICCRPAGTIDITVQCNAQAATLIEKSRQVVEIKSGGGTLVIAPSRDECYNVLADACEKLKWIAWYFVVDAFNPAAPDAWYTMDRLPMLFLPIDHLMYYLKQYNGSVDTWLKFNGETNLNWQTVNTSAKKLDFLYDLYENESYDWVKFRDTGALVKVKG